MRDYRKALGFSNASATKDYMSAKDIKLVNWELVLLDIKQVVLHLFQLSVDLLIGVR